MLHLKPKLKLFKTILLIIAFALTNSIVFSSPGNTELKEKLRNSQHLKEYNGIIISEIKISENEYTKRKTILIIAKLREGERFSKDKFLRSIQRLWTTDYFYKVDYRIEKKKDGTLKVVIFVKDKWSVLPIISYQSGGGFTKLRIGVYEGNLFGEHKEIGFVYENVNKEHFGKIWFEDRYLFGSHVRYRVNIFSTGFVDNFYNSDRESLLELSKRQSGLSIEFHVPILEDFLIFSFVSSFYYEKIKRTGLLNDPTKTNSDFVNFKTIDQYMTSLYFDLLIGKVNLIEDYYFKGQDLLIAFEFANKDIFAQDEYYTLRIDGRVFFVIGEDINFAHHIALWTIYDAKFYRKYFLGGFNNLRGFLGTRFHGENVYFYNAEFRIPFYKGDVSFIKDVVGSVVFFFDIGYAWDGDYFSKKMWDDYAADAGVGLRFKLRRIVNGQFRIDFAVSLHPYETDSIISTGLLHFF